MNHRQLQVARIKIEHPDWPDGKILRKAGYADATADRPGQNGLNPEALVKRATVETKQLTLTPSKVKQRSLETLNGLMDSENEGVAGTAAKVLLDYSERSGASSDEDIGLDDLERAYKRRSRAFVLHIVWTLRNPIRAMRLVQSIVGERSHFDTSLPS